MAEWDFSVARSAGLQTGCPGGVLEPGDVLEVFDSIFGDEQGRTPYHHVLIDYLCRAVSGDAVAGSDVSEVKWVTGQELTGLGLRESIERVVKKAIAQTSEGMHPES